MNLLAIDTSTELASVALTINNATSSAEQSGVRQHAQLLLPMIERLLAESALSLNQLDAIVYGCGPGSFTGLRVACSVAKGLAYAHDLPLFPVSSLAALANDALEQSDVKNTSKVLSMLDARMNQVYWACFDKGLFIGEAQVSFAAEVILPAEQSFILAGCGHEPYLSQLQERMQSQIVGYFTGYPNARAMIRLAQSGKINAVSAAEALPTYVRNQVTQGEPRG